jgi:hypothetical protein
MSEQGMPVERKSVFEIVRHLSSYFDDKEISQVTSINPQTVRRWRMSQDNDKYQSRVRPGNEASLRAFAALTQFIGDKAVPPATESEVVNFFRSYYVDPSTMTTESYLSLYVQGKHDTVIEAACNIFNIQATSSNPNT